MYPHNTLSTRLLAHSIDAATYTAGRKRRKHADFWPVVAAATVTLMLLVFGP